MKAIRFTFMTLAILALALPAMAQVVPDPNLNPQPTFTSPGDILPVAYAGNFVSSDDDQVCYDMAKLGLIDEVTTEMRGFKIDPPADYTEGPVFTELSDGGRYLRWWSENATVLAFILKGGSNYNVFNYVNSGLDADGRLYSPVVSVKKRSQLPAISHYNVCYEPNGGGNQGCTPGYWRNHADRWVGVASTDDFDATFGVDLFVADKTLGWAIWASGGGINALARHATAALLNANGGVPNTDGTTVDYPYSAAEVIQMVQDAAANGTIEETKDLFAAANELGCPLGGTRAVDVIP